MKKHILIPVLVLLLVVSLSTAYSFYPSDIATSSFDLNLREITYDIDTAREKGRLSYKLVQVDMDEEIQTHLVFSHTPLDALLDLGYEISNMQRVISTSPISSLYDFTYIKVRTFSSTLEDLITDIEYATIIRGNTLCESLSSRAVEQEGVLGIMTTTIKKSYEGRNLIAEEVLGEEVNQEPRPEIIIIQGPFDSPNVTNQPNTYDCNFWEVYINTSVHATAQEKAWLKFIMYCESGCNAASNKGFYKGMFQWDPCFWYKQFPNDNIFDGKAQIQHTLEKYRAGAATMWPACNRSYLSKQ